MNKAPLFAIALLLVACKTAPRVSYKKNAQVVYTGQFPRLMLGDGGVLIFTKTISEPGVFSTAHGISPRLFIQLKADLAEGITTLSFNDISRSHVLYASRTVAQVKDIKGSYIVVNNDGDLSIEYNITVDVYLSGKGTSKSFDKAQLIFTGKGHLKNGRTRMAESVRHQ